MTSLNYLTNQSYKNTYELESKPYNSGYIPYNTQQNISARSIYGRLSKSPPIILCQTSDLRNSRTHTHRYLFYPSISQLSPYSDNNNLSLYNITNQSNRRINGNLDLEKEINKLKEQNRLIKEEFQRSNEEITGRSGFYSDRNNGRPGSVNFIRNNELMRDLLTEKDKKIRVPLGHYNNRDGEYVSIANKQKHLFNTDNSNKYQNNNEKSNYYLSFGGRKNNGTPGNSTLGNLTKDNIGNRNNMNGISSYNDRNDIYSKNNKNLNRNLSYNDRNDIYSKDNNNLNRNLSYNDRNYIDYKSRGFDESNNFNNTARYNNNFSKTNNNNENNANNIANFGVNLNSWDAVNRSNDNNFNSNNNINDNNMNSGYRDNNFYSNQTLPNNIGNNLILKSNTSPLMNEIKNITKTDNNLNYFNNTGTLRNQNQEEENNPNLTQNTDTNFENKLKKFFEEEGALKTLKFILVDKNNNNLMSEEQKTFVGEQVQEANIEGDHTIVKTKDGRNIKLNPLRNIEGDIITDTKGNPILGQGSIYFIDKNGNPIVLFDKSSFDERDKFIPSLIKRVEINPSNSLSKTTFVTTGNNQFEGNNEEDYKNTQRLGYTTMGIGMGGYGEYRRKNLSKSKMKNFFPKGDGDAKLPIPPKRKRIKKKK